MTYSDLTPLCNAAPASSSGDINAQASNILKVLTGENATFSISSGISLPFTGAILPTVSDGALTLSAAINRTFAAQTAKSYSFKSHSITLEFNRNSGLGFFGNYVVLFYFPNTVQMTGNNAYNVNNHLCVCYNKNQHRLEFGLLNCNTSNKTINFSSGTYYFAIYQSQTDMAVINLNYGRFTTGTVPNVNTGNGPNLTSSTSMTLYELFPSSEMRGYYGLIITNNVIPSYVIGRQLMSISVYSETAPAGQFSA